jgi:cytochrome c-type biogenesis protein CcmH/NrfF
VGVGRKRRRARASWVGEAGWHAELQLRCNPESEVLGVPLWHMPPPAVAAGVRPTLQYASRAEQDELAEQEQSESARAPSSA